MEDVEEKQKKQQKEKAKEKALIEKKGKGERVKGEEVEKKEKKAQSVTVSDEHVAHSEEPKKEKKAKKVQETKARVRGKKYKAALKIRTEKASKAVSIKEALEILKGIKYAAFDESVEIHANLVKEGLRGEVALPHSTGKQVRVAIVDEALLEAIGKGKIEFDVLISHPSFMPKLARYAKILGPRGLMPSPKVGTISDKPEEAAKKFTSGITRWKAEAKFPLIHLLIGKISYDDKKLKENIEAYIGAIEKTNITELWVKTSMSPSIPLTLD
jgi:large subunit ribosomal protein L1